MKRWLTTIVGVVLLSLGTSQAQERIPVRIAAATATEHVSVFVGIERGIFAKYGLDAKVDIYPTGVEIINSLIGGQDDIAVLGTPPFLTGVGKGMPLVLIGHLHGDALATWYSGSNEIVASAASGLKEGDIKGLKGKKIGLPRGTGAETHVRGALEQVGLTLNDVTLVNLQPSDQPTALRNGDVDAISAWEPWASTALLRVPGAQRVLWGHCPSCYDPGTILTTRAMQHSKPEALRRFMLAFAESQQWMRQHFDEASEIGMHWIPGVDLDVLKAAIRNSGYDMRLSKNTITGYSTISIPALVKDNKISKPFDVASVMDPEFCLYAEQKAPEFFSDLKPIPPELQLK